jgi:RNA polymerase sigma factor FliA
MGSTLEDSSTQSGNNKEALRNVEPDFPEGVQSLTMGGFSETCVQDADKTVHLISYWSDTDAKRAAIVFEKEELLGILAETIDELPQQERLVISLFYTSELTLSELSAVLRIDEEEVRRCGARAIAKLRRTLNPDAAD